jgi:23S rRNA G2445 N2-methylase RlmL
MVMPTSLPACYAIVLPGLEEVTREEIERDLGGKVKRIVPGVVVFRVPDIDGRLLSLRTTEDIFLFAWGTDELTYRAEDLKRIQAWTAREVDWQKLLCFHHQIRPKPKGKPTYRLITQMSGSHGYRRTDAGKALARGLAGKFPASWRSTEDNAAIEVWLTIQGAMAVCGLRLSDRTMRHRTYKIEHRAASLRPTLAAAMVRLAKPAPAHVFLDPMCGAGTILAEQCHRSRAHQSQGLVLGGDRDRRALRAAAANLRRTGKVLLACWDARQLPLNAGCVDRIVSNPPFGKQMGQAQEMRTLYRRMAIEYDRVLATDGRAVLLVSNFAALESAIRGVSWHSLRQLQVRVLGQRAVLSVWRKS